MKLTNSLLSMMLVAMLMLPMLPPPTAERLVRPTRPVSEWKTRRVMEARWATYLLDRQQSIPKYRRR